MKNRGTSLKEQKKLYQNFPADIDTKAFHSKLRTQREWHRTNLKTIIELVNFHGKAALDVGCGSGAFDFEITSKFNTHITGIDFNDEAIQFAMHKAHKLRDKNLTFITASCENLPLDDSTFDIVFSCELIEHLIDPSRALKEMRRVCRNDGEIVLITQNWRSLWPFVEWLWDHFGDSRNYADVHLTHVTPKMLCELAEDSGFKVNKLFTVHNISPFFHLIGDWYPNTIEKFMSDRCLGLTLVAHGKTI